MLRSRLSAVGICLLFVLLAIAPASGIRVGGFIFMTDVAPGDHILHMMTADISDATEEPVDVVAQLYGCGMRLNSDRVEIEADEDESPYSAIGFLKVTPDRVTINPRGRAEFFLEVDVPEDVGSGGRYALVNIHTIPADDGKSVGVSSAVQVPVFLTIKGSEIVHTGEITDIAMSEDGNSLRVDAMFANTGNHHYRAGAEAVLKDEGGNIVAEASAPLSFNSIIPTYTLLFPIQFDEETKPAHGTYTVDVSVIHEDGTVLDTEEATFEV